jgi:hypothetical protein
MVFLKILSFSLGEDRELYYSCSPSRLHEQYVFSFFKRADGIAFQLVHDDMNSTATDSE